MTTETAKYSSNRYGKATGLRFPKKDRATGLYLPHGNGCRKGGTNCFTCRLPECVWREGEDGEDGEL